MTCTYYLPFPFMKGKKKPSGLVITCVYAMKVKEILGAGVGDQILRFLQSREPRKGRRSKVGSALI